MGFPLPFFRQSLMSGIDPTGEIKAEVGGDGSGDRELAEVGRKALVLLV